MIVVSHDRAFLNRHALQIAELLNGRLTVYRGNYSAYIEQRDRTAGEIATGPGNSDTRGRTVACGATRTGADWPPPVDGAAANSAESDSRALHCLARLSTFSSNGKQTRIGTNAAAPAGTAGPSGRKPSRSYIATRSATPEM